jgi:hypothetical protein
VLPPPRAATAKELNATRSFDWQPSPVCPISLVAESIGTRDFSGRLGFSK